MIDFDIPEDLAARRDEVFTFVAEQVVPFETDPRVTPHGPTDDLRTELVEQARKAGLLSFQAEGEDGSGITHLEQAILFEAAGWSSLGPVALNCAAPDEGNMYLLDKIASPAQAEEFLWPMIKGFQRSAFAMTEPGGAGSDPRQLATTAVRDGDGYVINGVKWLITGANGAVTWIIMADLEGAGAHALPLPRRLPRHRHRPDHGHDGPQLRRGTLRRTFRRPPPARDRTARRGG